MAQIGELIAKKEDEEKAAERAAAMSSSGSGGESDDDDGNHDNSDDGEGSGGQGSASQRLVTSASLPGAKVGISSASSAAGPTARSMAKASPFATPPSKRKASTAASERFRPQSGKASVAAASDMSASGRKPAGTVTEHIARLTLESALAGTKIGADKRWATKFIEDHSEEVEVELLRVHMAAIDAGQACSLGGVMKLPAQVLERHIRTLIAQQAEWPTQVKYDLVDRR